MPVSEEWRRVGGGRGRRDGRPSVHFTLANPNRPSSIVVTTTTLAGPLKDALSLVLVSQRKKMNFNQASKQTTILEATKFWSKVHNIGSPLFPPPIQIDLGAFIWSAARVRKGFQALNFVGRTIKAKLSLLSLDESVAR